MRLRYANPLALGHGNFLKDPGMDCEQKQADLSSIEGTTFPIPVIVRVIGYTAHMGGQSLHLLDNIYRGSNYGRGSPIKKLTLRIATNHPDLASADMTKTIQWWVLTPPNQDHARA